MLSRLARVARVAPVLSRQGAAIIAQPAPAVASRAVAAFTTDSSAAPAAEESLRAGAYAEILRGPAGAQAEDEEGNKNPFDWSQKVFGPDMKPLVHIPDGYNPAHKAEFRPTPHSIVPHWSIRHLRTPDVAREAPFTSVVADVPATNRVKRPSVSSQFNYKHSFTLVELSHNEFLKKLVMIESKLLAKFGSTAVLRVLKRGRPISRRFSLLRSPFVHKRAQDHIEYRAHEYQLQVSYTFELTDQVLNQYVFRTLCDVVKPMGSVTRTGFKVERRSTNEDKYRAHITATRAAARKALEAKLAPAPSVATQAAAARLSQSKNSFYEFESEASKAAAAVAEEMRAAREAEILERLRTGDLEDERAAEFAVPDAEEFDDDARKTDRRARSAERERADKAATGPKH